MRTAGRPQALVAAFLALLAVAPAAVAGTAAQVYYVPLPEDQIHAALTDVFPGVVACGSAGREVEDPILTYLSIAPVAQGTVITYDHWEDGYEPDLSVPRSPAPRSGATATRPTVSPPASPRTSSASATSSSSTTRSASPTASQCSTSTAATSWPRASRSP